MNGCVMWLLTQLYTKRRCCFNCHSISKYYSTFADYGLGQELIAVLDKLGFRAPTPVQHESVKPIIEGRNVIVNAETGSGKTLCFLLPIVNKLLSKDAVKPPLLPHALILVPSFELAHQIAGVFDSLVPNGEFAAARVTKMDRLLLKTNTGIIVAVPNNLMQYHLPSILRNVGVIVVDEADTLVTGSSGDAVWSILNCKRLMTEDKIPVKTPQGRKGSTSTSNIPRGSSLGNDNMDQDHARKCQIVFSAATLPDVSRKSAFRLISAWLTKLNPKAISVARTKDVHKVVAGVQSEYVLTTQDEKLTQLVNILDKIGDENIQRKNEDITQSMDQSDELSTYRYNNSDSKKFKIMIFTNTAYNAFVLYRYLDGTVAELMHEPTRNILPPYFNLLPPVEKEELMQEVNRQKQLPKSSQSKKWHHRCGLLHKDISIDMRQKVMQEFTSGSLPILITTDVGSRGLDISDVTAVVQFDFALSAVDYLHRSGRTARAGKKGKFFSIATEKDQDIINAIQNAEANMESLEGLFSRHRSFKRKLQRQKMHAVGN